MKKIFLILIPFVIIGCSSTDIVNLDVAKKHVQNYYENGQYNSEMTKIIDDTINKLNEVEPGENPLVIFDVDETALSNYEHTKELGFGFKWDLWHEWMLEADADAIPQTKRLYDWLIENDINVVFLTGRQHDVYDATLKNLKEVGFIKFDTLITRSPKTSKMSAFIFKNSERKILTEKGYSIIATIGDQVSDIEGKNTGLKVKLPNYLYLIE